MVREPAVAGRFYAGEGAALAREVDRLLVPSGDRVLAKGILAPHAGYVYSGAIAGAVYARLELPARVVVLGPNHTGEGEPVALFPGGSWRLPLAEVPIDEALTRALSACPLVTEDAEAHRHEHSLEVQAPFLARARPGVAIAALCLARLPFRDCQALGEAVARAASALGALVVASSDMSHYVSSAAAREKDMLAIERILALDAEGLHEVVRRERISMCGAIPATVMLVAARAMGATRAELIRYGNSGDVSGDARQVVGYAGMIVA